MFRYRLQRSLLVWLVLTRRVTPPMAAEPEPLKGGETDYRVTHWTAEQGLPQNTIKALAQRRDGYLWIGTLNGLARFDGVRFQLYEHENTPELVNDSINALAEDARDAALWIGVLAWLRSQ